MCSSDPRLIGSSTEVIGSLLSSPNSSRLPIRFPLGRCREYRECSLSCTGCVRYTICVTPDRPLRLPQPITSSPRHAHELRIHTHHPNSPSPSGQPSERSERSVHVPPRRDVRSTRSRRLCLPNRKIGGEGCVRAPSLAPPPHAVVLAALAPRARLICAARAAAARPLLRRALHPRSRGRHVAQLDEGRTDGVAIKRRWSSDARARAAVGRSNCTNRARAARRAASRSRRPRPTRRRIPA